LIEVRFTKMETPRQQGYRMPAEWEPHRAVWLSWPRADGISFPGRYDRIYPILARMIDALHGSEWVRINVTGPEQEAEVRAHLAEVRHGHVQFFRIPTNEPWCRDHGPIFLTRTEPESSRAIVDWGYNAWGGKYPPFDLDDVVPTRVAEHLGLPLFANPMILEGGSIEVNGAGMLLTTESCLLHRNRNPHLNREQIEWNLREYLGVEEIHWLGDGIAGDDTDGHIDDLTRFVDRRRVVTVVEEDRDDVNYAPLRENVRRLERLRGANGEGLEVVTLPMPRAIESEGLRLPASYANFFIGNRVVLLPVFDDPADERAVAVLADCFPGREIVPIASRELVWGLGAFHCLTQQEPEEPEERGSSQAKSM